MSVRRAAVLRLGLVWLGAVALAGAGAAAAEDGQVQLPQPVVGISATPPLTSSSRPIGEIRIPGQLSSDERIHVGVDGAGRPVAVTVTQRLVLNALGDYTFAVPAPVEDVLPAPGTESLPGFREGAILWQGFSPGRRVLAARAKIELAPAVEALPLALTLRATVSGSDLEPDEVRSGDVEVSLTVENRTEVEAESFAGRGDVPQLAETLDATVRSLRERVPLPAGIVTVHGPTAQRRYRVDAEFQVEGRLLFPRGRLDVVSVSGGTVSRTGRLTRVEFRGRVGGSAPKRLVLRLRGRGRALGPPRLTLEAAPVLEVRGLTPPRGGTWTSALRQGLVRADGETMLATAVAAYLRLAHTTQYLNYLLNPDISAGLIRNRADYVYETPPARAGAAPATGGGSGLGPLGLAAVLAGAVLAVAAGLVVWAYS